MTSNVGAKRYAILRLEQDWGEYDSGGDDVYIPFWDDGATVRPKNAWISQLHVTGVRGDTHRAQVGRDVAGTLNVGVWPELARFILDLATQVDGSTGDLSSFSLTIVDPEVECLRYYGLRVNTLGIRVSEGEPTLLLNMDLMGRYAEKLTGGSIPSLPSYPADISYILQHGALMLAPAGSYANRERFSSVEITVENNLKPGRHVRHPTAALDKTISSLRTGTQRVRGTVELEHEDATFTDALLAVSEGSLELLFAHPTGAVLTVGAAGAAAGSNVAIPVTTNPTGLFSTANEEHIFCETVLSDENKRSVAKVTALGTGPNTVTVAVLDRALVDGDKLYGHGLRVRLTGLTVEGTDTSGGREDNRNQRYEFSTSDDGTGVQFAYDCEVSA
ncbi:MAG: hypothetical protein IPK67_18705 [Planctomycetes bacterium]|nr:hypothetical protein [Planctomycetota bacterium]